MKILACRSQTERHLHERTLDVAYNCKMFRELSLPLRCSIGGRKMNVAKSRAKEEDTSR